MRGGERVLESLCRLYPDADIYTLFYDPSSVSESIRAHKVTASFLNPLRRIYRSLLPVMPLALEQFDLRAYDLVISSESGPAKGVLVSAHARHLCYCHSPMRYLWELYPAYYHDHIRSTLKRAAMIPLASYLRLWDYSCAARVDTFVANSENTRRRIKRAYGRESEAVYPPVAIDRFEHREAKDYYLTVSELVPYKQLDYAVRWFSRSGRKYVVAGDGPDYRKLKSAAAGNVEFRGRVSDSELRELYACCRAFVMPGEEDFGIAPVEALASGKPVIAFGRGGAFEIVSDSVWGVLYPQASGDGLAWAVEEFERREGGFVPAELQARAAAFSEENFLSRMRRQIELCLETNAPTPLSRVHSASR